MERPVSVQDVLAARDERAARQMRFLSDYAAPLISFTMNIAGEIKHTPEIERAFREGVQLIRRQLERMHASVLAYEEKIAFTGCEALFAVQADAHELKKRLCMIEETHPLGRLFDMDVIDAHGTHLTRPAERTCLICGAPVRACARSRAHTANELFAKAQQMIQAYFHTRFARTIGELAQKALLYEAMTTPKPGLVDCENSGAHRDMDLFSFASSACALRSYFEECVMLGIRHAGPEQLQYAGMQAEDAMFAAAKANTHKGAIFLLGILCHAMGWCGEGAALNDVLSKAAETGSAYLGQMPPHEQAHTGGEKQYHQYGLTGARGEAASGFRTVADVALPALESALGAGKPLEEACLHALLALMAHVQDSNIIRRAGMETQRWVITEAKKMLLSGYTRADLQRLNEAFVQKNISPGGSADLLAVTVFLYFYDKFCFESTSR